MSVGSSCSHPGNTLGWGTDVADAAGFSSPLGDTARRAWAVCNRSASMGAADGPNRESGLAGSSMRAQEDV